MADYVVVSIDTITGKKEIPAPTGGLDKTAISVWLWLLNHTEDHLILLEDPIAKKRDIAVAEGKINALAIVLANAVGMASSYWEMEARRLLPLYLEMRRKTKTK